MENYPADPPPKPIKTETDHSRAVDAARTYVQRKARERLIRARAKAATRRALKE